MPALSFNKKFVPHILNGTKKQTIRKFRKKPINVGNRLFLYTGMRTKQCKKIGEASCVAVYVASITRKGIQLSTIHHPKKKWKVDEKSLDAFARSDGFSDWEEMHRWWGLTHDLPFKGNLIMWENFVPA